MIWYTVLEDAEPGMGDYGGGSRVIFDGLSSHEAAMAVAKDAELRGAGVTVFRGKSVGRPVYRTGAEKDDDGKFHSNHHELFRGAPRRKFCRSTSVHRGDQGNAQ